MTQTRDLARPGLGLGFTPLTRREAPEREAALAAKQLLVSGAGFKLRAMEWGRSYHDGDLLLIKKATRGTVPEPTIDLPQPTIAIPEFLCNSLRRRRNAWDGQGPKLFESAPKFPRKVKKRGGLQF